MVYRDLYFAECLGLYDNHAFTAEYEPYPPGPKTTGRRTMMTAAIGRTAANLYIVPLDLPFPRARCRVTLSTRPYASKDGM